MARSEAQSQASRSEAILAAVDSHRLEAEAEGYAFTGLLDPAGRDKIKKGTEPLIVWQTWKSSSAVGTTLICDIGVANPAPETKGRLFLHLFVGTPSLPIKPGGPPWVDLPQLVIDPRFPRLTLPRFDGLVLEAGQTRSLSFGLPIPSSVDRSNYFAHALLIRAGWHEQGQNLDRSLFIFEVI